MSNDLSHLYFLKMMKRYGKYKYKLLNDDIIRCFKPKGKKYYIVSIYIIGEKPNKWIYESLEASWSRIQDLIESYKFEKGYSD